MKRGRKSSPISLFLFTNTKFGRTSLPDSASVWTVSICSAPCGTWAYAKQSVILLFARRDNEKINKIPFTLMRNTTAQWSHTRILEITVLQKTVKLISGLSGILKKSIWQSKYNEQCTWQSPLVYIFLPRLMRYIGKNLHKILRRRCFFCVKTQRQVKVEWLHKIRARGHPYWKSTLPQSFLSLISPQVFWKKRKVQGNSKFISRMI